MTFEAFPCLPSSALTEPSPQHFVGPAPCRPGLGGGAGLGSPALQLSGAVPQLRVLQWGAWALGGLSYLYHLVLHSAFHHLAVSTQARLGSNFSLVPSGPGTQ